MQKRHKDRQCYFNELANTSRSFYIDYVKQFISLSPSTHILEIGCGEGGNLLPFAELGCKVTGIDRAASRIHQAETFFAASGYKGEFTTTDFFNFSSASRYQLILIHDVIEHISNKEEFFRCLSPLLAKGGIIFWGFPSWQMPLADISKFATTGSSPLSLSFIYVPVYSIGFCSDVSMKRHHVLKNYQTSNAAA